MEQARIDAWLSGKKTNTNKSARDRKRIFRSIEIARDNALDAIDVAKNKMEGIGEGVGSLEADELISKISDYLDEIKTQEAVIERLEEVCAYLQEEIDVEGEEK